MKDINKIDDFVFDALSDYSGEPSPHVINQIRKKMYFSNLATRFKYLFFNLTTLISVVSVSAIIILAVIYLPSENNSDNKNIVAETTTSDAKIPVKNELTSHKLTVQTTNNEYTAGNPINSVNQSENKPSENSEYNNNNTSEEQKQTTKPIDKKETYTSGNSKSSENDKTSVSNNEISNNKPKEKKQNLMTEVNQPKEQVIQDSKPEEKKITTEKKQPDPEVNYLPAHKEEAVVLNQGYQTTTEIKAAEIPVSNDKESDKGKTEPIVAENHDVQEIPVETARQKENVPDALKSNMPDTVSGGKNNDYAKKSSFSIDGYFAYGSGSNTFSGSQSQSLLLKETTGKPLMMTGGLSANYHLKNLTVSCGLGYSLVKEDFSFSKNELSLDTSYTTETVDIGYFDIDSSIIGYDIDSLFVVIDSAGMGYWEIDSIPVWGTDSVWVPVDSTYTVMDVDSLINTLLFNARNKYTYLEIPIVFGYEFGKNKLTFPVKIGLITGIFLNAQGKGIDLMDENGVVDLKNLPFMKINLTGYLSAGVNYRLSNNYCIFVEGYVRKKLNSDYEKTYMISKKTSFFGAKAGFRYNF